MQYYISIQLFASLSQASCVKFRNTPISTIDTHYRNDLQVFDCFDGYTTLEFNLITKTNGITLLQSINYPHKFLKTTIDGVITLAPYSLASTKYFEWYPTTKVMMPPSQAVQATLLNCSSSNQLLHRFREVG